jgi:Ring finger domain
MANSTGSIAINTTTGNDYASTPTLPGSFLSFVTGYFALFFVMVAVSLLILIVMSCWIRELCYKQFGCNCCPGSLPESRRREMRMDQILAAQLRMEMEQQARENADKQKEFARLELYQQFLNSYTRIVQPQDFVLVHPSCPKRASTSVDENDNDDDAATVSCELGQSSHHCSSPKRPKGENMSECSEDGSRSSFSLGDDDLMIQFSTKEAAGTGKQLVCAEATCSICLLDYRPGDCIVWSAVPGCRHVYHVDCMLLWMATGKNRCPVCRNHFLPSKRTIAAAVALQAATAENRRHNSSSMNSDASTSSSSGSSCIEV